MRSIKNSTKNSTKNFAPKLAEDFAIIGSGPAGLAAAYELAVVRATPCTVFEQDSQVGGLSRTVNHNGYRCDIGGHRFFTKNQAIEQLWHELLPDDFLRRTRLSYIYFRDKFFNYPLKPMNVLRGIGPGGSVKAMGSFLRRKVFPIRPEASFADWVSNRFGRELFEMFFKTYTEKVWGISSDKLSAEWAAQRIRNLNLARAVINALGLGRKQGVTSLIEEFDYPNLGPGQMYEAMARKACQAGARVLLEKKIVALSCDSGRVRSLEVLCTTPASDTSQAETIPVGRVISSMPISELVQSLRPAPPADILQAAAGLRYRSIITVNLILQGQGEFPATWVYLHAPKIRACRAQFYSNWSPALVPNSDTSTIGLEYFCNEGDETWTMAGEEFFALARRDLAAMGVADPARVADYFVVRYPKAYPIYDAHSRQRVQLIRSYLESLENLVCVGRYGQFRYNNMDHSILTGQLGARKLLGEAVDPWYVNEDAEYLEEVCR